MLSSWEELETMNELDEAHQLSFQKPVVLFKHSVTCGISARSKYMLEANWRFDEDRLKFYYLDLLNHRTISNKIAEKYSVRHQSPQIIIVINGQAVFDASHHRISTELIARTLDALPKDA
jgi:bacillithiol system protein YtxJ